MNATAAISTTTGRPIAAGRTFTAGRGCPGSGSSPDPATTGTDVAVCSPEVGARHARREAHDGGRRTHPPGQTYDEEGDATY